MASNDSSRNSNEQIEREGGSGGSNEEPPVVPSTSVGSNNGNTAGTAASVRKKRFSSRNYRNRGNSSGSSSDDDEVEDPGNTRKTRRLEVMTTGNLPPDGAYDVVEEGGVDDGGRESDDEDPDDDHETEVSSSVSDTSSSDSNHFDNDSDSNDSGPDVPDKDVEFLNVERPKCTWFALRELFYREHGLSGNGKRSVPGREPQMFKVRVCGSLNVVERLELMYKMEHHEGCVNSLNFSQDGTLLASGSDDKLVVIWNWASSTVAHAFNSGHYSNVFQTKFYGGNTVDIRMITTARDGLVRSHIVPSGGGSPTSTTHYKHIGACHRVVVLPHSPFEIMSAGEDGMVMHIDMRTTSVSRVITVKENKRKVVLYGLAAHPMNDEFCVYGQHRAIKIYDRRNTKSILKSYYPNDLAERSVITCATYNANGTELIGSYSDQDIFLFDRNDEPGQYQNNYRGHSNSQTIKGVNFYGAGSNFIVSGSDCGNIFFWDKKTSKIVQWIQGDENGAINVLEPHPAFPILATSGLDSDVKIWVPSNEKSPDLTGLVPCVKKNMKVRHKSALTDIFDEEMFNLVLRQRWRRMNDPSRDFVLTTELQTASDAEDNWENNDSSSSDDDGGHRREAFPCSPM